MGLPFPEQSAPIETKSKKHKDMQRYYSQTFREYAQTTQNVAFSSRTAVTEIFTKTRDSTSTFSNRQLALLDIDKIISFNIGSLREQGERVRNMRMVAQLMQQERRRQDTSRDVVAVLQLLSRRREELPLELMRGEDGGQIQDPTIDMLRLQ